MAETPTREDWIYFKELALRAPPVPEWFTPSTDPPPMPDQIVVDRDRLRRVANYEDREYLFAKQEWDRKRADARVIQWPHYYAKEVMNYMNRQMRDWHA